MQGGKTSHLPKEVTYHAKVRIEHSSQSHSKKMEDLMPKRISVATVLLKLLLQS